MLELKDKLALVPGSAPVPGATAPAGSDALNALVALGYGDKEARATLAKLPADLPLQDAIRQSLRLLSRI